MLRTSFLNLPALGRCQHLYIRFLFRRHLCFWLTVAWASSLRPPHAPSVQTSQQRLPLSRSYGYILPSSLTRVLPRTLGFSPRIPVSVYGTGGNSLTRSFSRQCGVSSFGSVSGTSTSRLRLIERGFAYVPPYTLVQEQPISCLPALLCHSIAQTIITGTGISASCPSPTLHASD